MNKTANATAPKHMPAQVFNDKADNQGAIERRLVGQLGDRYKHAELLELSRNNYLISHRVRLPVLGRSCMLIEPSKENLARTGYQRMKDVEFYSSRRLANPTMSNLTNVSLQRYVLDPRYR